MACENVVGAVVTRGISLQECSRFGSVVCLSCNILSAVFFLPQSKDM